jgi:uncharacterized damage-inducible protein DinB
MSEAKFLSDQIRVTYEGDSWHGPSVMKTLEGVDYKQARTKLLQGRHSIWELVDHINIWMSEASWAVENRRIYDSKSVKDWLPMGQTEKDWRESVERLRLTVARLVDSFSNWRIEDFDRIPDGARYSYRQLLNGVIHHSVYHAGQIAILKQKR